MSIANLAAQPPLRRFFGAVLVGAAAFLGGCATHYVDGAVKDVATSEFVRPSQPRPVQMLFEFQTKGVTNARATEQIKGIVGDAVRSAGIFSEVRDGPVDGGGVVSVTLDNVPLTDDAYAKGFLAGMTFGAAGQQVTDGYVCTVSYLSPGAAKPVLKTARHAIHTSLGAKAAPPNAYKAENLEDAVRTMVRQVMGLALSDLSRDPGFH